MNENKNIVTVKNSEGFQSSISTGNHSLNSDEPIQSGGSDTGPSPYELLLSSLGACKAMTMRMYASRKSIPLKAMTIRLSHDKIYAEDCMNCETKEGKIDSINVEISFIGNLTEEQRESLLNISEKCPVHRTLVSEIKINSSLTA